MALGGNVIKAAFETVFEGSQQQIRTPATPIVQLFQELVSYQSLTC